MSHKWMDANQSGVIVWDDSFMKIGFWDICEVFWCDAVLLTLYILNLYSIFKSCLDSCVAIQLFWGFKIKFEDYR